MPCPGPSQHNSDGSRPHSSLLLPGPSWHTHLLVLLQQRVGSLVLLPPAARVRSPPWTALDGWRQSPQNMISSSHRPRRPLAVHVAEPGRPTARALQHAALLAAAVAAGAQGLGAPRGGRGGGLAWGRRLLPASRQARLSKISQRRQQAVLSCFCAHLIDSAPACLPPLLVAAAACSSAATPPWSF